MPSRFGVGFILLFWGATTAFVGYREVWPWLASDGPPPLRIDLADEAAAARPAGWAVYRGNQRVGSLVTRMEYFAADDTFRFLNTYQGLSFDFAPVALRVPPGWAGDWRINGVPALASGSYRRMSFDKPDR